MNSTIRVLAIDQSGDLGGAELSLLELLKNLRCRHQTILLNDGPFRHALEEAAIPVTVINSDCLNGLSKNTKMHPKQVLLGAVGLVRRLLPAARDADVIYTNTQRAMVLGAIAGLLTRRPVVWHMRDIVSPEHFGPAQRTIIKWCTKLLLKRVIANSQASADALRALTGIRDDRLDVIFNGIDSKPFDAINDHQQSSLRARFGLPQDAFLVGCFSRLARWKGQHLLLEAMRKLPKVHAVFVGAAFFGEETYESELHAFVTAHGLEERVHFLGFQRDVAACMKAVDVVAHTSIDPEPFGRVIVEGMLAKRPVVAANAGGVVEIVTHAEDGLLYAPGNADDLAAMLHMLYFKVGVAEELIQKGYQTATTRFGTARYVADITAILTRESERKDRWALTPEPTYQCPTCQSTDLRQIGQNVKGAIYTCTQCPAMQAFSGLSDVVETTAL